MSRSLRSVDMIRIPKRKRHIRKILIVCEGEKTEPAYFKKFPERPEQFICPAYYFIPRPPQCTEAIDKQSPRAISEHKLKFAPCLVNGSHAVGKSSSVVIESGRSTVQLTRNGD